MKSMHEDFVSDECGSFSWTVSLLVRAIRTHRGMKCSSQFKEIPEDHLEI